MENLYDYILIVCVTNSELSSIWKISQKPHSVNDIQMNQCLIFICLHIKF